jgi:hypothetical protein
VVVPTGRQEYFVLGYEQHLYNMLRRVYDEYGAALAGNRMNSVVSVVASADDQIVTYDHWEDGLDADPWSLTSVGPTTLVLGDNDAANGRACDWILLRAIRRPPPRRRADLRLEPDLHGNGRPGYVAIRSAAAAIGSTAATAPSRAGAALDHPRPELRLSLQRGVDRGPRSRPTPGHLLLDPGGE